MIDCLANAYMVRSVGDHAENAETAIKHGMTALRGMEEIPLPKPTTLFSFSTYRFRLVQACLWLSGALPSDTFAAWHNPNPHPEGVLYPSHAVDSEGSSR
jgi:hypothetical protein